MRMLADQGPGRCVNPKPCMMQAITLCRATADKPCCCWHSVTVLHTLDRHGSTAGATCLGQCLSQEVPASCSIVQGFMWGSALGNQPLLGSCQEGLQLIMQAQPPQRMDDAGGCVGGRIMLQHKLQTSGMDGGNHCHQAIKREWPDQLEAATQDATGSLSTSKLATRCWP